MPASGAVLDMMWMLVGLWGDGLGGSWAWAQDCVSICSWAHHILGETCKCLASSLWTLSVGCGSVDDYCIRLLVSKIVMWNDYQMFPLEVAAVFVLMTRLTVWTVNLWLSLFQTWGKGGRGLGWDGVGLGCWVGRTIWAYSYGSSHCSCAFPHATCLTNRTIGKCSATWLPDCEFLFHSELAFSSIYILQIKVSACAQFCAATTSLQFCICYNNLFGWEVRLVSFREGEASMRRCRKPIME